MYIYIETHWYVRVHVSISHVCIHIYIYIHVYTCMCICMSLCVCLCWCQLGIDSGCWMWDRPHLTPSSWFKDPESCHGASNCVRMRSSSQALLAWRQVQATAPLWSAAHQFSRFGAREQAFRLRSQGFIPLFTLEKDSISFSNPEPPRTPVIPRFYTFTSWTQRLKLKHETCRREKNAANKDSRCFHYLPMVWLQTL